MTHALHAQQAGHATPNNEKGPTVAAVAPQKSTQSESPDSEADVSARQVAQSKRARLRTTAKRVIVTAACWGFPASWAHWLIARGGLADA